MSGLASRPAVGWWRFVWCLAGGTEIAADVAEDQAGAIVARKRRLLGRWQMRPFRSRAFAVPLGHGGDAPGSIQSEGAAGILEWISTPTTLGQARVVSGAGRCCSFVPLLLPLRALCGRALTLLPGARSSRCGGAARGEPSGRSPAEPVKRAPVCWGTSRSRP